jgi:tetratricopeptide (TPR) repeat protein
VQRLKTLMAVCGAAALLLAPGRAPAAGTDKEAAKQHFDRGVKHYNLGHFADAITEFEQAYDIEAAPILLFNIAQSHRQTGNKERALFFYRRYLEQAPNAANRGEVDKRMKDLEESMREEKELKQKPPPGVERDEQSVAPPAATPPAAAPVNVLAARDPDAEGAATGEERPIWKKWWFWTAAGGVLAAGVLTAVLLAGSGGGGSSSCRPGETCSSF